MCAHHSIPQLQHYFLAENRQKKYYLLSSQHISKALMNITIDKQRRGEYIGDYMKGVRATRVLMTDTPLRLRQLLSRKLQRMQKNRQSSIGSLAVHIARTVKELDKDVPADTIPDAIKGDDLYDCYLKSGLELPSLDEKHQKLDPKGDEYRKLMV